MRVKSKKGGKGDETAAGNGNGNGHPTINRVGTLIEEGEEGGSEVEGGHGHVEKATEKAQALTIRAPNFKTILFKIRGTTNYVQHKFSAKAREIMRQAQEAGSTAKKKGGKKPPKDFDDLYTGAIHRMRDGKGYGIPAVAFFKAMVSACRLVDFKMTVARQALYVHYDGMSDDPADRSGLVKITSGEPTPFEAVVRLPNGSTDIRVRPLWEPGWTANVRVRFDADMLTPNDVANLLMRAGVQVGVGEGRPDSSSGGQGWGLFELVND